MLAATMRKTGARTNHRVSVILGPDLAPKIHRKAARQRRPVAHLLLEQIAHDAGLEYVPYRRSRYIPPARGAVRDGRMIMVTPVPLYEALSEAAAEQGVSRMEFVRRAARKIVG